MVYGDALVETGDPRGELVVAQCTLADAGVESVEDLVDVEADASELARLAGIQRRVQQLEALHGKLWSAPLELPEGVRVQVRRGMPESVSFGEGVEVGSVVERLAKVTPIGELSLQRRCKVTGLERIASWSGLRVLEVIGVPLPWDVLERMITHGSLRCLRLVWAKVDAAMVDRLAQLPALRKLQRLELSGHRELGVEPIVRLLSAHPDLVVAMRSSSLRDEQIRALLQAAPQLRGLDVRDNPLSVAVLRELVALPRLRYLGFDPGRDVKHDKGTVGRAVAKATAPLRSLALGGSVNGPGLAAIAATPQLADGVRAIDLANDRPGDIGDEGNAALASMRGLVMIKVRTKSTAVGLELMKLPTLAYFDCGYIAKRLVQRQLAAHYGSSVPAYREREPTYARGAAQRRIEVPDEPGISMAEIGHVIKGIVGLAVEQQTVEWSIRDPRIVADPIGVTLKKYPNKPRYITLWYWPEDAAAWAARLDQLATALAKACNGRDVDGPAGPKAKPKPQKTMKTKKAKK
jgi:hypothetical protein